MVLTVNFIRLTSLMIFKNMGSPPTKIETFSGTTSEQD